MKRFSLTSAIFAALFGLLGFAVATPASADGEIRQWVGASGDGVVEGRILVPVSTGDAEAVQGAEVLLRSGNGTVYKAESRTDETGRFRFIQVPTGAYTVISRGDRSFLCGVLHVVPEDVAGGTLSIDIPAARLDRTTIKTAVLRYLDPSREPQDVRTDLPPESMTSSGAPMQVAVSQGGLSGRLMRDAWSGAEMTNVFIFKDGVEVRRTVTEMDGKFRIDELETGVYSLIGAGPHGFCAVGFELLDPLALSSVQIVSESQKAFVALADEVPSVLSVQLAPPGAASILSDESESEEVATSDAAATDDLGAYGPMSGGGTPGGGGGFSGGGGGSGDLGALAGLAGLGAAIAVVTADDDGVVTSSPPSPIVP
ncbi:carboxypeptidase-like regulatory domain-containing protein [Stieleria varia]|uniref:Cna protein B-type domain protein n=1 Tax=Stieleria varia TaxID=2528005 RepID=A0A5C6AYK2_9BACT|nr:carboxypeptidase-like regulatory domain-containing protein [Stieleria varia]TWU04750.1 hypothetical protein Pla52n_27930 [Stieleria varia]